MSHGLLSAYVACLDGHDLSRMATLSKLVEQVARIRGVDLAALKHGDRPVVEIQYTGEHLAGLQTAMKELSDSISAAIGRA